MFYKLNLYRIENFLPQTKIDDSVCELADLRLSQIKTDFSHDKFNEMFVKVENGKVSSKDKYDHYENLGKGYPEKTPVENLDLIFELWKKSPTHNKMLLSKMTETCFRTDGVYWVMEGRK